MGEPIYDKSNDWGSLGMGTMRWDWAIGGNRQPRKTRVGMTPGWIAVCNWWRLLASRHLPLSRGRGAGGGGGLYLCLYLCLLMSHQFQEGNPCQPRCLLPTAEDSFLPASTQILDWSAPGRTPSTGRKSPFGHDRKSVDDPSHWPMENVRAKRSIEGRCQVPHNCAGSLLVFD